VLAEHERKRLVRRTKAGLAAARARCRTGGRPKGLSEKYRKIQPMVCDAYAKGRSVREIRQAFGIRSNEKYYKIVQAVRSDANKAV
jgi:DNA invertase Pin-like site-specific DNA recombinase